MMNLLIIVGIIAGISVIIAAGAHTYGHISMTRVNKRLAADLTKAMESNSLIWGDLDEEVKED